MSLNDRLKEARKNSGMTQKDVEDKTNIKANTISNWEQGISEPDVDKLKILCSLYHREPNYFFEWYESRNDIHPGSKMLANESYELLQTYNTATEKGRNMAMGILISNQEKEEVCEPQKHA